MADAISVQDKDRPQKRVCMGTIATAHGVRGLVKVKCDADDPAILNGPLYTSEKGQDSLNLLLKNSMGKYWLAEIEGINDRDAALALRGTKLWLDREELPDINDEDEFYCEDLIGLEVITTENEKHGTIISVDNFGAGDLLEIRPLKGDTYYLPFTKENVPEIKIKDSQVVIGKIPNE